MAAPIDPELRKTWKRVLYEKQGYPDDHVDDTFLESLVTNANAIHNGYWTLVRRTFSMVERLSLVVLFFALFFLLWLEKLTVPQFLVADAFAIGFMGMFALIFWRASATDGHKTSLEAGLSFIKYTVLFVGIIWALSPVFQTLTSTFSDDTMWALTVFFSFLHVALFDYIHAPHSSKFSGATSLNAAMFAAVLLASRLPTSLHVLALMVLAVSLFGLYPLALQDFKNKFKWNTAACGAVLAIVDCILLVQLSYLLAALLAVVMCAIVFVCPAMLLWLRPLKNEINGPWDIAQPHL